MTAAADRRITPPTDWARAIAAHRPPAFDVTAHRRVVVVAAHPDDETIGAGGVLLALASAGCELSLVVATDGEAAYPALDDAARRELARVRRDELLAALRAQGCAVPVTWLGLPDSGLAEHTDELRAALEPLLAGADAYLAPWPADPHPDHRAAGLAAAAAAPVTAHGWSYPIWMWAWTDPRDPTVPWDRARLLMLDAPARAARRAGVRCFASQLRPGPDGSPPVLAAGLLEHLDRDADLVFREPRGASAPVARFAELYAGGDPWAGDSWYEVRKRAVVLAALPRERYRRAFEPGCGAGELTAELAGRCDVVHSSDPVPAAVERAAERVRRGTCRAFTCSRPRCRTGFRPGHWTSRCSARCSTTSTTRPWPPRWTARSPRSNPVPTWWPCTGAAGPPRRPATPRPPIACCAPAPSWSR